MRNIVFGISCILVLCSSFELAAQQQTQVITKRIEKSFTYRPDFEVNIDGERAEVRIETWDKPLVQVQLDLIAKHPSREIAQRDVEYMQYLAQRLKNKVYLRNYISVPEGSPKPESQIRAVYLIKVPKECPVYLKNNYGIASISNLSNRLRVNSRFSRIGLENIQGMIDIQTQFGDLVGNGLDGNVHIASRRSDLVLRNLKGTFDIDAQYGVLKIFADAGLLDLNLRADKSEVFMFQDDLDKFSYDLSVQHGNLELPNGVKFNVIENRELQLQKANFRPTSELYPRISISITFGDLTLGKQK